MRFNTEALALELRRRCVEAVNQALDELFYDTLFYVSLPQAMTDYERSEITEEVAGVITGSLVGGAWAVMDEWGTGSLMDLQNPFLDDYWNSDLWNPARRDTAIRTRPKGEYTNIFGRTQRAVGNNPGFNLERVMDRPNPPNILLTPPSHAMQMAIGWLRAGGFAIILERVLQEMDWGAFLEVEWR